MISSKGRYALRVMIELAELKNGEFASIADISEKQSISPKYLEAIISKLYKNGLVESRRGKSGGYKLSRPTEAYTLKEIIEATEGELIPVNCACIKNDGECERASLCPTAPVWKRLDGIISDYLDSITLKEMLSDNDITDFPLNP